jgi:hypothetical protein
MNVMVMMFAVVTLTKKLVLNKLACQFVDAHIRKTQNHMVLDSTIGVLTYSNVDLSIQIDFSKSNA